MQAYPDKKKFFDAEHDPDKVHVPDLGLIQVEGWIIQRPVSIQIN